MSEANQNIVLFFSLIQEGNLQRVIQLINSGYDVNTFTDLYHFRARYYDPETGRFISRDPVEIIEAEPESSNLYQFVYNNPHVYSDPTGRISITSLNASLAVQDILQSIKTHGKLQLKQQLQDEVENIATDVIVNLLRNTIPFVDSSAHTLNGISLDSVDNPFERAITDTLCDVIRGAMPSFFGLNYLWFQPHIDGNGDPSDPGFNPSPGSTGCGVPFLQVGGKNKPELIIKRDSPTDISSKSYLLLEVKTNLNSVSAGSGSQFQTFIKYVNKHSLVSTMLYVSLKTSPTKENKLIKRASSKGVLLNVIDFGF